MADFNVRELSRIISDDPALAARTLSLSRSARYALRFQPRTVHEAILVLGFHVLGNVVIATAAQSFIIKNRQNQPAPLESLLGRGAGVAAAGQTNRSRQSGDGVPCGSPARRWRDDSLRQRSAVTLSKSSRMRKSPGNALAQKEVKHFHFDHATVGMALLDFWNIDQQVGEAVLEQHHEVEETDVGSLRFGAGSDGLRLRQSRFGILQ